ncbi:S-layer homology domain-containing protein [Candidatus Peregrinibacteria bacterium]|nr:S-layer homology domain-containing protein [Candidatus Peregrinibacteria bacterium]
MQQSQVEALKILGELVSWDLLSSTSEGSLPFQDVSADEWYSRYLLYAVEKNIIDDSGNFFEPAKPITRGKMAEYIYRDYVVRETGDAYDVKYDAQFIGGGSSGTPSADCTNADIAQSMLYDQVIANDPKKDFFALYRKKDPVRKRDYFQVFTDDSKSGIVENVSEKSWFFWLDTAPNTKFGHDTKMMTVNFNGCTISQNSSFLWPIVDGKELWNTDTERTNTKDLTYVGTKAGLAPQASLPSPVMKPCNAPADSKKFALIVSFGEDRFFKQDAVNMNTFLCNKGYQTSYIDNTPANPFTEISRQLDVISTLSTRNGGNKAFFFYVTSHGMQPSGNLVVRMENGTDAAGNPIQNVVTIPLPDLAETMKTHGFETMNSEEFSLVHDTCYSGNVVPLYEQKAAALAKTIVGWVSASSQSNQESIGDSNTGSYHTNTLLHCIENSLPYASFAKCVDGEAQKNLGADYATATPIIEKLTPATDDVVPFLP